MAPPPPVSPSPPRWPLLVAGGVLLLVIAGVVLSRQKRADAAKVPSVVASASARPRSVVPVALRPRASLAGAVRDRDGKPVAQASVCAVLSSTVPDVLTTSTQRRTPRCVTSGSDGAYTLTEVFSRTRLVVSASAEGFAPGAFRGPGGEPFVTLDEGESRTGVDLVLAPGVALRGRVSDVTGGPVSGALVSTGDDESPHVFGSSDARGEFTLWVEPGTAYVRATAQGYAPGSTGGPAPEHFFAIQLVPGATLVGRVVLAGTETPVAGARVEAIQLEGNIRRSVSVRSDEDGRFRVEGLEPGRYRLESTSEGREGYSRSSVTLAMGETSSEVVVEMDPAYTVRGRVVDDAGKPCTGGDVQLTDHAQNEFAQSDIDGDGWAEMRSVIPGSYEVEVNCKGALSRHDFPVIVVADRDAPEQRWTVDRGARVVVTVVDAQGKLVPRAQVSAQAVNESEFHYVHADRPEADGTYLLGGLVAGEHEVTVRDDGARSEQKVTVSAHGEERLRFELKAVGGLDGVVEDEDHHPVGSVSLWISGPTGPTGDEPSRSFTRSLDDGTFHMTGLLPGEYTVTAGDRMRRSRRDGQPKPTDDPEPPSAKVTVTAPGKAKVRLTVPRREGIIEGRVVTREGNPVTDAFLDFFRVRESRVSSSSSGRPQVMTDMDGHFRIEGLEPGDYRLRATRRGGGEATAEGVKLGRRDVVMTLSEGGVIAGHLDSPKGAVERFEVKAKRKDKPFHREEMFFHAGGAFALHDLPAGTYEVEAETPLGVATAEVTLAEGEKRTDLRLRLSMRGSIDGRVVSLDTGAPIAGVNITLDGESSSDIWKSPTVRSVVTGPDGRFHVDGVLAGSWAIVFGAARQATVKFETQSVPVTVNESAATDLGTVRIAPRRVDEGKPQGQLGLSVTAWNARSPGSDGLAVSSVSEPAEAAGIKEGDVIVSVDGTDVRGVNGYLFEPLITVPPGRSVSIGLARGQVVTVVARGDE